MADIQVLAPHIADLIAAGEVVERPASVIKELMENAIDAGAAAVSVEIEHGGFTFLRVTDNGGGIPPPQMKTAFLRHATSKLRTEYDLEAIGTLGFRGEALAAIAAVSRVQILSRTPHEEMGATLSLEGGVPGEVEPAGCPLGTTIVVRDLFYNTPARLKFMKKDAAEGAAVFAMIQRVALSHPEVSVKFIRDGKQELHTPGDGQLESTVYAVLGRDLALGLRPVQSTQGDIKVSGFVSLPACCRNSRSWQFFFVNGRQVKSRLMMAALEEAYKNQKMVGKFPACVLHLQLKHNAVDVNVHPAKTEVKFSNEREVFSAVHHGVLAGLQADRSHVELGFRPPPSPSPAPPVAQAAQPAQTPTLRVRDAAAFAPVLPGLSSRTGARPTEQATPFRAPKPCIAPEEPVAAPIPLVQAAQSPTTPVPPAQPEQVTVDTAPSLPLEDWRLAGEVLNTYIIAEQGEKIYLIDKHAVHERLNFDRMKEQGYDPMAQTLLVPVLCRLPVVEQQILLEHEALLAEFGFEIDELGGAIAVRQAPFDVAAGEIEPILSQLAQTLLAGGGADVSSARDELLHTMACKGAIKGGWKTGDQELTRLAHAVLSGQVRYCPHGRPVAIELTRKELERQFKRS